MNVPEISSPRYGSHEQLVAPARARAEIWRLLAGLGIVAAVVIALNLALLIVISAIGSYEWAEAFLSGSSPLSMLVLLSSFAFVTLGVRLAVRRLHQRSLASVLGPLGQSVAQFWVVLRALVVLGVVITVLPPYDMGSAFVPNLALSTWLLFLPLSLGAVLIQTSAEEFLFRGYMQQALAARFRSPAVWILVPSLLFGIGHYAPGTAEGNAGLIALWSIMFGVFAADLTARSGTLGPAIALHFFNNTVALLFISLPDSLSGLALFHLPYDMSDTGILRQWLYVDFAIMTVSWLTARLALRR